MKKRQHVHAVQGTILCLLSVPCAPYPHGGFSQLIAKRFLQNEPTTYLSRKSERDGVFLCDDEDLSSNSTSNSQYERRYIDDLANETAWDKVESVSQKCLQTAETMQPYTNISSHEEPKPSSLSIFSRRRYLHHSMDDVMGSWVLALGIVSVLQSLTTVFTSNSHIWTKIASIFLSHETLEAVNTIRTILESVQSEHGIVVDVFRSYKRREILTAIYALSRLQHAAHYYEWRMPEKKFNNTEENDGDVYELPEIVKNEPALIEELAHYAIYANLAYGWAMDLAFRQRLHLGGSLQALLKRTGVPKEDVIMAEWESKTNRPAYFCLRDRKRKSIVLAIRGTWSAHDVLTDLCCAPSELDPSEPIDTEEETPSSANLRPGVLSSISSTAGEWWYGRKRQISGHHGMLKAARSIQKDVATILKYEFEYRSPDYSLVLVGHSMGGGVAALLGTLLERSLPKYQIRVYLYGAPCVSTLHSKLCQNIVSVIRDGDPFRCISLGHVADISVALAQLCDDPYLRNSILLRTNAPKESMEIEDLEWCYHTMQQLRTIMDAEKLYPPGRLLLLSRTKDETHGYCPTKPSLSIKEVPPEFFRDLIVGARMFALNRHIPSLYESELKKISNFI